MKTKLIARNKFSQRKRGKPTMKHRTHKLAAKTVAAILCAALMLTACGSKETTSNETASTETTSVESTEMTTTEAAVAEPAVEPTEAPCGIRNSSHRDCSCGISCTCRGTHSSTCRTHYCKHRVYLFGIKPDHVCEVRSKCQRPAQHRW